MLNNIVNELIIFSSSSVGINTSFSSIIFSFGISIVEKLQNISNDDGKEPEGRLLIENSFSFLFLHIFLLYI